MSHKSKAKAKGISATSFFDLKAELSKQEADFAKNKAAGKSTIVGGVPRPDKKVSVWARQNKGVAARANRDVELEAVSKPTLEAARAVLERKAKIYEKLRKGKSGGLTEAQYDSLLVDFDAAGPSNYYESDSDDVDESLTVPKEPGENESDPVIEYEDEFGRVRTSRLSEVPRHLLPKEHRDDLDEDEIIYNPQGHFPTYVPSEERIQEIEKKYAESNNPLADRYDSTRENRAKGAGFYQFSLDEETRKAQMDALKAAREETERVRQETGAVDIRPGETEGVMREGEGEGTVVVKGTSRAMDKRKRELEERRKLIEAKRRKVAQQPEEGRTQSTTPSMDPQSPLPPVQPKEQPPPPSLLPAEPADPFAVLEASLSATHNTTKSKPKTKAETPNAADEFLSKLEEEFLGSKGGKKRG